MTADKTNETNTDTDTTAGAETQTHECRECRKTFPDHETLACDNVDCDARLCDRCATYCKDCEHVLCDDCAYWCARCDERVCDECRTWCDRCETTLCDRCYEYHACTIGYRCPDYRNAYEGRRVANPFTFGVEIEIDGEHDEWRMQHSPLIAGWRDDGSLHERGAGEYQTHPLVMGDLDALETLIEGIDEDTNEWDRAGGHIHVSRTDRQTPSRWYWALKGLTDTQTRDLNMRHVDDDQWCRLSHNHYCGKATAVNADHSRTIELRTFGAWHESSAHMLKPAVRWMHTMWRFFQAHELHSLKTKDIMATSRTAHAAAQPPRQTATAQYLERSR